MAEEGEEAPADFGLPGEVMAVLPADPFEQLDVARKITSIALASRVGRLEAEAVRLRAQLAERDAAAEDLRERVEQLSAALALASDRLRRADEEKETLLNENATLSNTIKKLNRDVAKSTNQRFRGPKVAGGQRPSRPGGRRSLTTSLQLQLQVYKSEQRAALSALASRSRGEPPAGAAQGKGSRGEPPAQHKRTTRREAQENHRPAQHRERSRPAAAAIEEGKRGAIEEEAHQGRSRRRRRRHWRKRRFRWPSIRRIWRRQLRRKHRRTRHVGICSRWPDQAMAASAGAAAGAATGAAAASRLAKASSGGRVC